MAFMELQHITPCTANILSDAHLHANRDIMSKITVIRHLTVLINYIHDYLILSKVIVWHALLLFYILFFENGDDNSDDIHG